jgi:hypothetical protein
LGSSIASEEWTKLEEVCIYTSGCFSDTESRYPSSHKEILAVKNGIKKFRLFLKPVHFIVRTDLKHMKGMLSNQSLLEQGNNRVLRWSLWLDGFDFEIHYKPGKDNCIADLLTREAKEKIKQLNGFILLEHKGCSSTRIQMDPSVCNNCKYCYCFECLVVV